MSEGLPSFHPESRHVVLCADIALPFHLKKGA